MKKIIHVMLFLFLFILYGCTYPTLSTTDFSLSLELLTNDGSSVTYQATLKNLTDNRYIVTYSGSSDIDSIINIYCYTGDTEPDFIGVSNGITGVFPQHMIISKMQEFTNLTQADYHVVALVSFIYRDETMTIRSEILELTILIKNGGVL